MKKVILDENLPHRLRTHFSAHEVVTVHFKGWLGVKNGDLLALIDQEFDVFLTADQKLRYQQNLKERRVAIIEVPSTKMRLLEPYLSKIAEAINRCGPGDYIQIHQ